MTLKDALGFVIDYGKFIATLWNGYVVFTVAVIGWLVSLRSKEHELDLSVRKIVIGAYLAASVIFGFVLWVNQRYFAGLHEMLHQLADSLANSKPNDAAVKAYGATLRRETPELMLNLTLGALAVVAFLAAWVMWFITSFQKKAEPSSK